MKKNKTNPGLWEGQWLHFTCIALLVFLMNLTWRYLGEPFPAFFWGAVTLPIIHQIYVWLAWRLELHNGLTSKAIGFNYYLLIFFILFISRFISLLVLAWKDHGSLNLGIDIVIILTLLLALPGIYAAYSVIRYFGIFRAAGADHFDIRYRDMPLVNKGIFRFTSNGMYVYAFLLFWAIAIGFNSSAALAVAAFSHIYIWIHFYATEKPDMDFLYSLASKDEQ